MNLDLKNRDDLERELRVNLWRDKFREECYTENRIIVSINYFCICGNEHSVDVNGNTFVKETLSCSHCCLNMNFYYTWGNKTEEK